MTFRRGRGNLKIPRSAHVAGSRVRSGITTDINSAITPGPLSRFLPRSPPRTRRSSASSIGSCAGTMQSPQSAQLHAPRSISSNRSRSPTPHHAGGKQQQQHQHQPSDEQRKINRSRSPTPQRKFLASPNHQAVDLGKQRSRSPTPRANLRSRSPTSRMEARSPTNHGKPQENGRVSSPLLLFLESERGGERRRGEVVESLAFRSRGNSKV